MYAQVTIINHLLLLKMFSSGVLNPYYNQYIYMYLNNTYTLLHKC